MKPGSGDSLPKKTSKFCYRKKACFPEYNYISSPQDRDRRLGVERAGG